MGTGTTKEGARAAGRGVPVSTPPHLAPKGMLAPGFGVMSAFLWGVHVGGGLLGRRVCMCSYSFNSHSHPRPVRVLVPSLPWQGLALPVTMQHGLCPGSLAAGLPCRFYACRLSWFHEPMSKFLKINHPLSLPTPPFLPSSPFPINFTTVLLVLLVFS